MTIKESQFDHQGIARNSESNHENPSIKSRAIYKVIIECAIAIAATSVNIGCEKKAPEGRTGGRRMEDLVDRRTAPRPDPGQKIALKKEDSSLAPAKPPPRALTPSQIYAAEKKRQGGDPTAPIVMYLDQERHSWAIDPTAPAAPVPKYFPRRYYYYNENGANEFGDNVFITAEPFFNGIALVSDDQKYGFYGHGDEIRRFYYFINRNGVNAFGKKRYLSVSSFIDGIALAEEDSGGYVFINHGGIKVFDNGFTYAEQFSDGFARVICTKIDLETWESRDRKVYFINKNGVNAFGGKEFEQAWSFSDGLALIKSGEKYHYINKNGVNAFGGKEFDSAEPFKGGFANVAEGIRPYVINKRGEEVK